MTPRERLIKTLNHETPDRLCVDMGAGGQTGIGATALHHLNRALLPEYQEKVKIIEPYQMLGEVEEPLRKKLQLEFPVRPPYSGSGIKIGSHLLCLMERK